jgi:pantoate--beta-alanine ligase
MELIANNGDVALLIVRARQAGESIGLVPTMGALHEGHAKLIALARENCARVAVSIFVNPTQFAPQEDYHSYPPTLTQDSALCAELGVDWVYAPPLSALYPSGPSTTVVPPRDLTERLCGEFRPGHFSGVATVVAKLLALWRPDRAYFGQKDFQQTRVIQRLIIDLCFQVKLEIAPTVREPGGLALSSRNRSLSQAERQIAQSIPDGLLAGWQASREANATPKTVLGAAHARLEATSGIKLQYLELVDSETLAPATELPNAVLTVAAFVGNTRLIDNVPLAGVCPFGPAAALLRESLP